LHLLIPGRRFKTIAKRSPQRNDLNKALFPGRIGNTPQFLTAALAIAQSKTDACRAEIHGSDTPSRLDGGSFAAVSHNFSITLMT
jgi:hypothetical protein